MRTSSTGIPAFVKAAEVVEDIVFCPTTQWDYPHEGSRGLPTRYNYQVITATPSVQHLGLSLEELRLAQFFSQYGLTTPEHLTSPLNSARCSAPSNEALKFVEMKRVKAPIRDWEKQVALLKDQRRPWTGPSTKQLFIPSKVFYFDKASTKTASSSTSTAPLPDSPGLQQGFFRNIINEREALIATIDKDPASVGNGEAEGAFRRSTEGYQNGQSGYESSMESANTPSKGGSSSTPDSRPTPLWANSRTVTPMRERGADRAGELPHVPSPASTLSFANLSIAEHEDTALAIMEQDWEEKRRNLGLRKAALARAIQEYDIAAEVEAIAFKQYTELRLAFDD
ncbi:hypothetical protein FRB96_007318 [Tulasnella sp. 330]|nr:hypothetical protein FRB96_007318 [Tulasnella sp. 330]